MDMKNLITELLKEKGFLTPLQQDILDTWNELQRQSFDMSAAERQILSNDAKYPQIAAAVAALPTTVQKARSQITEQDLRYILAMQLNGLAVKETEVRFHGQ